MGKSRKKTPVCTWCCCKSQKRGKQISHRKFRRLEQILVHTEKYEFLPFRQWEIVMQWDLGGDGKHYCALKESALACVVYDDLPILVCKGTKKFGK